MKIRLSYPTCPHQVTSGSTEKGGLTFNVKCRSFLHTLAFSLAHLAPASRSCWLNAMTLGLPAKFSARASLKASSSRPVALMPIRTPSMKELAALSSPASLALSVAGTGIATTSEGVSASPIEESKRIKPPFLTVPSNFSREGRFIAIRISGV